MIRLTGLLGKRIVGVKEFQSKLVEKIGSIGRKIKFEVDYKWIIVNREQ